MTMRRTKTTRTKTASVCSGPPSLRGLFGWVPAAAVMALALAAPGPGQHKPRTGEPYALIGGTVFRDPGFALPGAKVVLALESQPEKKLEEQISSPTGEFAFRVKPGANRYIVTAALKGFHPARKVVEIAGQEQVRATLLLVPVSHQKGR